MARQIEIVEVSARDGLQNEKRLFSTDEKVALITFALQAGIRRMEVASFVHPKVVPQMADAERVVEALPRQDDVTYIGLVLNLRGAQRAVKTKVDELGAVVVASDTFGQKNQGQTSKESVTEAKKIISFAKQEGRTANVTISTAFGCPFDGEVSVEHVTDMAVSLAEAGPCEIAIADTIGSGDPWKVTTLINQIKTSLPKMPLRAHFHNTRNTGLANAYAAIMAGASTIDASIGGIGGCPFAPAATGNIPTEDLIYMLQRGEIETGVDLKELIAGAKWLSEVMNAPVPGMMAKAGMFPAA